MEDLIQLTGNTFFKLFEMPPANLPKPQFFNVFFPAEYVAHVEINRPQKLNAFVGPMWYEMKDVFESLSVNPDVRCVLFSGAGGKAFTAGKGGNIVEYHE